MIYDLLVSLVGTLPAEPTVLDVVVYSWAVSLVVFTVFLIIRMILSVGTLKQF